MAGGGLVEGPQQVALDGSVQPLPGRVVLRRRRPHHRVGGQLDLRAGDRAVPDLGEAVRVGRAPPPACRRAAGARIRSPCRAPGPPDPRRPSRRSATDSADTGRRCGRNRPAGRSRSPRSRDRSPCRYLPSGRPARRSASGRGGALRQSRTPRPSAVRPGARHADEQGDQGDEHQQADRGDSDHQQDGEHERSRHAGESRRVWRFSSARHASEARRREFPATGRVRCGP